MKVRSLKINSIINIVKTLLGIIFPLITFPYASRVLGVENIGKVNYANSIVSYFVLFAGLGITTYATREGAKIRDDSVKLNKLCSEMFIINSISTIIASIGVVILSMLPVLRDYRDLILLFGTTLIFNLIGINWLFNIFEDYLYITIRTLIFQIISLILLFVLVRNREDYIFYAAITVFSNVGANVYNMFYGKRYIKLFSSKYYEIKKHMKPIMIIFGMSVASAIYLNMDTTMIGAINGNKEVGLYTAAVKINRIVCTLITSACTVLIPRLSYYLEKNRKEEFKQLIFKSTNYILLLTIPSAVGLSILSEEIICLFSGKEFIDAIVTMKILSPNIILSVTNGFLAYQIFMPLGKEKEVLYATISGAIINGIFNMLLIPAYGARGAAVATILAELTVFIVCRIYMCKFYKGEKLFTEIWKYIIGSVAILIVGINIRKLGLSMTANVMLCIIASCSIYLLVLVLLKAVVVKWAVDFVNEKFDLRHKKI